MGDPPPYLEKSTPQSSTSKCAYCGSKRGPEAICGGCGATQAEKAASRRGFFATLEAALGIIPTDARFDRSDDPTLERLDPKCRRVVS